jgi:hypothetical protein
VIFRFSTSGPAYAAIGPSYKMFCSVFSYTSNFVPQDEISKGWHEFLSDMISTAKSLAGLGDNSVVFANNADAVMGVLR